MFKVIWEVDGGQGERDTPKRSAQRSWRTLSYKIQSQPKQTTPGGFPPPRKQTAICYFLNDLVRSGFPLPSCSLCTAPPVTAPLRFFCRDGSKQQENRYCGHLGAGPFAVSRTEPLFARTLLAADFNHTRSVQLVRQYAHFRQEVHGGVRGWQGWLGRGGLARLNLVELKNTMATLTTHPPEIVHDQTWGLHEV